MTTTLARYLFLGNPISPSVNNNDDNILSYYSQNTDDPGCRTSPWSDWSPCSNKCGSGYQRRTRLYMIPFVPNRSCDVRLYDKQDCYMQEPSCDAYSSFSNSKSVNLRSFINMFIFEVSKNQSPNFKFWKGPCWNRLNFSTEFSEACINVNNFSHICDRYQHATFPNLKFVL